MRLTVRHLRSLIREVMEKSFNVGDFIVPVDYRAKGIFYDPHSPNHGKSYVFYSGEVQQVVGPPQQTEWGVRVPISVGPDVYFINPDEWRVSKMSDTYRKHWDVDSNWWPRRKKELDLGIRLGRGSGYKSSDWRLWKAPDNLTTEKEVMAAFDRKFHGWPLWSAKAIQDLETGEWYVNYEVDTSD